MRIAIAGDSVGVSLVDVLVPYLKGLKDVEVTDMSQSPTGATGEYYANIAERVAQAILAGQFDRGANRPADGRPDFLAVLLEVSFLRLMQ